MTRTTLGRCATQNSSAQTRMVSRSFRTIEIMSMRASRAGILSLFKHSLSPSHGTESLTIAIFYLVEQEGLGYGLPRSAGPNVAVPVTVISPAEPHQSPPSRLES